jgi:hypothetical protein
MKNISKNIKTLLLAGFIGLASCDTVDFGDTNVDPNSPSAASTASLMTNAQLTMGGHVAATTPNLYVQYLSNGQYDEESRYQTLNWSFNGFYATLTDLQKVIELNTNEETKVAAQANGSNANQIAAATILKSYYFHQMTDIWGMIPYSEALGGLESQYPKFDSQQSVYTAIFAELDSALNMINSGNGPKGDILFRGDMSKWRMFANTIKMTMALRLSKADPSTGRAKFSEAYNGSIDSNSNNLYYTFLSEDTNDNPWQDRFETRRDYLVSDVFVNALIGSGTNIAPEDPRLEKMAAKSFNGGVYAGAPYGKSNSATDDYSFITGEIIYKGDAPLMIYTYAESLFARAEAASLGWTSENTAELYAQAIKASMAQWGVDSADADAYVAANPYTSKNDIAYEKWVAMYMQGYNSWAEWRRQNAMGYGVSLTAPEDLLSNATGIPQRHGYSATASALNEENYNAAISAQGADNLDTVLWINK